MQKWNYTVTSVFDHILSRSAIITLYMGTVFVQYVYGVLMWLYSDMVVTFCYVVTFTVGLLLPYFWELPYFPVDNACAIYWKIWYLCLFIYLYI
jgi:hypothetical protein